jgi:type IV secretory pathway VirB3-like protein
LKKKRNDEGKVLNKRTLEYVAISYVAMSIMVLFINIPTKIYLCIKKPSWFNKKIALKGDKFRSGDIAATINWIFRPFH